ncbi:MAG TPA: MurR/RpiR family transcriptional regulator, partial [Spirochaetia bacterium]|nr:MurR/RpiR family transcriptional regulator [Spirochaetia bacterium]
ALQIAPGVPLEEIARSLVHNNGVILQDILKTLDMDSAKRSVEAICAARKVDIYGTGASGVVAHEMTQKLLRIGISASYHQDADLQIVSACGLAPGDAAIAFSYSGENRMVNSAVNEAKTSGATTISVTRFSHNTLSDLSDINLFVPSTEPILRDGRISSRIAQLVIVDIIFSGIVAEHSDGLKEKLARTYGALHEHA